MRRLIVNDSVSVDERRFAQADAARRRSGQEHGRDPLEVRIGRAKGGVPWRS